ncbi:AraC family transcriptional regulator [Nannocystis bainbridge]|uniref:AraC family transcriptional regulator n=1 Tax=Nannocystis bainbridge TaxID=2995303 RepID=A0ABT5EBB8_9BACT|nr:AraC family transcriptional regulator [Nannocystis bainbridge]MDC0723147.1 AraC family transcriptional regulator [Nannocystis bainbridge]
MATTAPAAAELAAHLQRHTPGDGVHATALPRVSLIRAARPGEPLVLLHEPALCVVAQGTKRVHLADEVHVYDASRFLVVTVDLPVTGQVVEASPAAPYLCLRLDLDPAELAQLLLELGPPPPAQPRPGRGLYLSAMTPAMLDAVLRLVRLLDVPEDIAVLAPLAVRELTYRLLKSDEGWRLRQIAAGDGQARRIARAIDWLKQHYAEPLRIDEFARELHMSASSLHHHFKAVTAMSPLQYQKQLRLQEARRLMFSEALDATSAAFRVGYESASQFSREYTRLFGDPPARDLRRLRETGGLASPV